MSQGFEISELPEGWARCSLADGITLDIQPGFACGSHNRDGEGIAHLRPMNVNEEGKIDFGIVKFVAKSEAHREERLLRSGDVLFNNTNSPELVGKTACYQESEPKAFSNHMTRVRCNLDALDPQYCAFSLHHLWQLGFYESICNNHVSQASISRSVLLATKIPFPPLAEQKRIVAKVETLLARVNAARQRLAKVPSLLKRFRQSTLSAACSGQLTAEWRDAQAGLESATDFLERLTELNSQRDEGRSRNRKANDREDSVSPNGDLELFEIPDEWCWVKIRTIMDEREAFCYGVVQPGADNDDGVPLIRAGDLEKGTVNSTELRRIPVEIDLEYKRSKVSGGELLVTVVGAGIGAAAIVPDSCKGYNIARAVAKIPVRASSSKYVLAWLESSAANQWMKSASREVARPTLNLEQLETLPVPLPPLAEQHEIVRRVEALFARADRIEMLLAAATRRVEALTQAILAQAFRGELVPTEAELARREGRDYEPASALLVRVRAQQLANGQTPYGSSKKPCASQTKRAARRKHDTGK